MLYGAHVRSVEDVDFLRGLGLDFGEVVLWDAAGLDYWPASGIRNDFDSGFFLMAHGPNEGPPNDLSNLRDHWFPRLCSTVDVTAAMGMSLLVVHLWMDRRFVKPEVREEKKRLLRDLCDYAGAKKILIALENLSEDAEDLAVVVDAVPGLAVTLDVGHGQLLAETNTAFRIIDELGNHIRHVHLHDNRGGKGVKDDLHLPIGEGVIDFPAVLRALVGKGYDGTITLEVKKHVLEDSLNRVRSMVRDVAAEALASAGSIVGEP